MRVLAPTSTMRPSGSCCITTRLASHARRCDVPAGTRAPSSKTDWAGSLRVRQHRRIDVDHDLVALARGARVDAVMKRRLRQQRQRVGLLLGHGQRIALRLPLARLLVQRLASRGQRLHKQRAGLGSQPAPDSHHAVFALIHLQRPTHVLEGGLSDLFLVIHPTPATDDPLDVLRRPGATNRQQPLFFRWCRHAGERPHLGVRELAASECLGEPG